MIIFTGIFLVPLSSFCGDNVAEGNALLKRAAELSKIDEDKPLYVRSSVTLFGTSEGMVTGTMLLYRESATRWRREFHLKGYDSVQVVDGDRTWRLRSAPYTPALVRRLSWIPMELSRLRRESARKLSDRKLNDVRVRCVETTHAKGYIPETWCFSEDGTPAANYSVEQRTEYSDYTDVNGRRLPGRIKVFQNSILATQMNVSEYSAELPSDPQLLAPPSGAIESAWCENMVPPSPIHTPDPNFPLEMRRRSVEATTKYQITIGTDGRVENVYPLTTRTFLEPFIIETLKDWRSKPAMCGNTPVPFEVEVEFAIHLGR